MWLYLPPVSGNPRAGSTLALTYRPVGWVLEVYSIQQVVRAFVGGWKGTPRYPPVREMEAMVATLAQMAADALELPVHARARLVLDTGGMRVTIRAGCTHNCNSCPRGALLWYEKMLRTIATTQATNELMERAQRNMFG